MMKMKQDGVRRALAFVTSAYSSYSGCRQYRENIACAQEAAAPGAPEVHKIRAFYNHPGFIEALVDRIRTALEGIPESRRASAHLVYTAHSIPLAMAQTSRYEDQLRETGRLVAEHLSLERWTLVYQSRSGPASQPWLEPDILYYLRQYKADNVGSDIVIAPIGFVSDHMEILFDLDTQARELCQQLSIHMIRAETVGTHPRFIRMIRELICERIDETAPKLALGTFGPRPDFCPEDCCPGPRRPPFS
jgi:ferrochelatase